MTSTDLGTFEAWEWRLKFGADKTDPAWFPRFAAPVLDPMTPNLADLLTCAPTPMAVEDY